MPAKRKDNARTPGANRLLRELQRWQMPRQHESRAARWLTWSDAWTERLRRMVSCYRSPAMVVVQPMVFVQRLRERWLFRALRLCPQIHLAVHPALRETNARETILRDLAPRNSARSFQGNASHHIFARSLLGGPSFENRLMSDAHPDREFDRTSDDLRSVVSAREAMGFGPLSLVFHRMAEIDAWRHSPHCTNAVGRRVVTFLDQVVRRRLRWEESTTKPNLIPARPQPRAESTHAKHAAPIEEMANALESTSARSRWKQSPAQPPALNVEVLTDQVLQRIDRRVLAWRERTGRR